MSDKNSHGGASLAAAVRDAYARGQTDYYMEPLVRVDADGRPVGKINDGDAVIFCCRRGEREIELTEMFTESGFDKVEREPLSNLDFVILTMYHEKFRNLPIAFAPIQMTKTLTEIISDAGLRQLHCAESQKFAHVTFFFNGGSNSKFAGEEDICVPSPKCEHFEDFPELSLAPLVDKTLAKLPGQDFAVVNFANGDIIGHTSDNNAKIAAAHAVDESLHKLAEGAKALGFTVVITADHGNLERMTDKNGRPDVAHTRNQVPFIVCRPKGEPSPLLRDGSLCDVAPTVLHIMGLRQPEDMTGRCLTEGMSFGAAGRVLLIILDGWGFGACDATDPIHLADTPYWDSLLSSFPVSRLEASGSYVGLGADKAGNSEAGHINLGAGRIVIQDDMRLEYAISDGSFARNPVITNTLDGVRARGSALHLIAYLTKKSSHGSIEYPLAICRQAGDIAEVYLHIIFDGRSTQPGSAPELLEELDSELEKIGVGEIVDGVGRGLVLERDMDYAKVKKGYDAMVLGTGTKYR